MQQRILLGALFHVKRLIRLAYYRRRGRLPMRVLWGFALLLLFSTEAGACEWQLNERGRILLCASDHGEAAIAFACPFINSPVTRVSLIVNERHSAVYGRWIRISADNDLPMSFETEANRPAGGLVILDQWRKADLAAVLRLIGSAKGSVYLDIDGRRAPIALGFAAAKIQQGMHDALMVCAGQ